MGTELNTAPSKATGSGGYGGQRMSDTAAVQVTRAGYLPSLGWERTMASERAAALAKRGVAGG